MLKLKFMKKVLLIFMIVLFSAYVTACENSVSTPKNYKEVNIETLMNEARSNPAAANKKYSGKNVKIVGGYVLQISDDGNTIWLNYEKNRGDNDDFRRIICSTNDQEIKNTIMNLSKRQSVIVYGTIEKYAEERKENGIGWTIYGYLVNIDKIE